MDLPHSGPRADSLSRRRDEIIAACRVPTWDGNNWVAGPTSLVLLALSECRRAERVGASECVLEYLRHVVSVGGMDGNIAERKFGRQRAAHLKLSAEWAEWEAARKADLARISAAHRDGGDDRGYHGGFLSSDD